MPKWVYLILATVFACYGHLLMEWLFYSTKPSFMSTLNLWDKLKILLVAPLPFIILALAIILSVMCIARVLHHPRLDMALRAITRALPAAILAILALLLIDNFTYTLFKYGIQSSQALMRPIFALIYIVLLVVAYKKLLQGEARLQKIPSRVLLMLAGVPVLISLLAMLVFIGGRATGSDTEAAATTSEKRPNIFLFCIDGANAEHFSLYGYPRDTTPFFRDFATSSLVCDNAFPNACDSGSSDMCMLTGKLGTTTRLIYPPDILRGKDAYQHFPGILKNMGYHNISVSVRHYVDPYDLNMQNAFDEANFRRFSKTQEANFLHLPLSQDADYFIQTVKERVLDRLLHIFCIKPMENAYREAVTTFRYNRDSERITELKQFINSNSAPIFAHIHLIGTHGAKFNPRKRLFSLGKLETENWMTDFYDDGIREADNIFKELVDYLKAKGLYDNSILVIYSDHGQGYVTHKQLPLILHFPDNAHAGRIEENAQSLDIAPTILDFMGVKKPEWMAGSSLIAGKPDPNRFILSTSRRDDVTALNTKTQGWEVDASLVEPPFYHLGYLNAIVYDKYYRLDLIRQKMISMPINGHAQPADANQIPSTEKVEAYLVDFMKSQGYDMSGFTLPLPKETIATNSLDIVPPPPQPLKILDWGPRFTKEGQPFQVQPDGSSAIWCQVDNGGDNTKIVFGGTVLDTNHTGKLFSALVPKKLYDKKGTVEIHMADEPTSRQSASVKFLVQ